MSQDLLTHLTAYGEYCDDRQGSVTVEEVLRTDAPDPSGSTVMSVDTGPESGEWAAGQQRADDLAIEYLVPHGENTPPGGQKRRNGVVLAIAAAILLLVGVVVVADGDSGDVVTDPASSPTVTDPPVSPPDATEPVALPSVFDPVSSHRWSLSAYDPSNLGCCAIGMQAVTIGGPGLVAVGQTGNRTGPEDDNATVWTSVDGITWSRVDHHEAMFGDASMSSVTAGGPGLVAVGNDAVNDDLLNPSGGYAVVWTSVDGFTWSRVPHDEAIFGDASMTSVTAGGPGLVAVGSVPADDGDGMVWISSDGRTWSRVPPDDSVLGGAGEQEMRSVTAGGPGRVVVGMEGYHDGSNPSRERSPNGYVPVVWTSADGITWSRVPHDETVFGEHTSPTLHSVIAGGPGVVAVGAGGVIVAEPVADDAETTVDN
jgi:hypothetical protein